MGRTIGTDFTEQPRRSSAPPGEHSRKNSEKQVRKDPGAIYKGHDQKEDHYTGTQHKAEYCLGPLLAPKAEDEEGENHKDGQ
jgi:hypothetical protein